MIKYIAVWWAVPIICLVVAVNAVVVANPSSLVVHVGVTVFVVGCCWAIGAVAKWNCS